MRAWERPLRIAAFVALLSLTVRSSAPLHAQEGEARDAAFAALDYGASISQLVWTGVNSRQDATPADADAYTKLAARLEDQIAVGRASAGLATSTLNVIGTTLIYASVVDPEPLSKGLAALGGWGAKKAGEALGNMVLEQSQAQAKAILAQGLKNSGLTPKQLKSMKPEELRARVADMRIGNQKLRDVLKDQPESLAMLQANAVDIATDIGVEALSLAQGTAASVEDIKKQLKKTDDELHEYQAAVTARLDDVGAKVDSLHNAVQDANTKLKALHTAVQGNTRAIQTIAEVSYSGWSVSQKLQAVQAGLFPHLDKTQTNALIASLEAEQRRENFVAEVQQAAQTLGNLAAIANNLGIPRDTVQALQTAQVVAAGVAQFATGNYLGAVATITGLGVGSRDAGAERHAAMMKYLEGQFQEIQKKLNQVIELQVATLKAVAALAEEQQAFRRETLQRLDQIEDTVLTNQRIAQAILLSKWTECSALIRGTILNNVAEIPDQSVLLRILSDKSYEGYAGTCYFVLEGFLDAYVRSALWSGQLISSAEFPVDAIANSPSLQAAWTAYAHSRGDAFAAASRFLVQSLRKTGEGPARVLARLSQPVVDVAHQRVSDAWFGQPDVSGKLDAFLCNDRETLSQSLAELLCYSRQPGAAQPPLPTRLNDLISAPLLGPHALGLIDTGLVLATVSDFARRSGAASFAFEPAATIRAFSTKGPTQSLRAALKERKGIALLRKLQWLADSYLLQQSVTYGDYTAKLVERQLYDPKSRSITLDLKNMSAETLAAYQAIRSNPKLAQNVVLLAMRHAIEDALGGTERASAVDYHQTFYHLAIGQVLGGGADVCKSASMAWQKMRDLLPNWRLEYRATSTEKRTSSSRFSACNDEVVESISERGVTVGLGSGISVTLADDFYVPLPSVTNLTGGRFEHADSLKLALIYRDKVNQALIDRRISDTLLEVVDGDRSKVNRLALSVVDRALSFEVRQPAK